MNVFAFLRHTPIPPVVQMKRRFPGVGICETNAPSHTLSKAEQQSLPLVVEHQRTLNAHSDWRDVAEVGTRETWTGDGSVEGEEEGKGPAGRSKRRISVSASLFHPLVCIFHSMSLCPQHSMVSFPPEARPFSDSVSSCGNSCQFS